jgi:enoyl-CoA hydratase
MSIFFSSGGEMAKVRYEIDQGIARITMDDGKANAMDFAFFEEMEAALDRVEGDGAKMLIITGRSGFFSGGLNIKLMPSLSPTELNRLAESLARTILRVFAFPLPTIAACSGHAVAGGAMLSFSCDGRFVVDGPFRIQMNEILVGIPFPSWMLLIGRSAVPVRYLADTFLHARSYSPTEAVDCGLFHGLIKEEDPVTYAKVQGQQLNNLNLSAYKTSKKRLREEDVKAVLELLKNEVPFPDARP